MDADAHTPIDFDLELHFKPWLTACPTCTTGCDQYGNCRKDRICYDHLPCTQPEGTACLDCDYL